MNYVVPLLAILGCAALGLCVHLGLKAQHNALIPPMPPRECFTTEEEYIAHYLRWIALWK